MDDETEWLTYNFLCGVFRPPETGVLLHIFTNLMDVLKRGFWFIMGVDGALIVVRELPGLVLIRLLACKSIIGMWNKTLIIPNNTEAVYCCLFASRMSRTWSSHGLTV